MMFEDKETETFFTVVHMFQRSAMANLGLLEHPEGGLRFNFSEAKDIIDIIQMLRNKTQGNLDPSLLHGSTEMAKSATRQVLDAAGNKPGHIFNLGHGFAPSARIECVETVLREIVGE